MTIDTDHISASDPKGVNALKRKYTRSAKACIECHNKKVKCDVSTKPENTKCTNCIHNNLECVIYVRKKRCSNKRKHFVPSNEPIKQDQLSAEIPPKDNHRSPPKGVFTDAHIPGNDKNTLIGCSCPVPKFATKGNVSILNTNLNEIESIPEKQDTSLIPPFPSSILKAPIQNEFPYISSIKLDPNDVLKENMRDLMMTEFGLHESINNHLTTILDNALYQITENNKRAYSLDTIDFQVLEINGCFTLPDEETCWKCIRNFFEYINPQLPIVDKQWFYKNYADLRRPPSLLLLYSILFIGAWHANSEDDDIEKQNENIKISQVFFRRAKLLYECSIEVEPIAIIQSLILFSFNNNSMSSLSKIEYYWSHVAVVVALQYGFHLKPPKSLPEAEKRIRKRLWWILYYRDRSLAFGYSRPSIINLKECEHDDLELEELKQSGFTKLESLYIIYLVKFGKLFDKINTIQQDITKSYLSGKPVLHLMKKCDSTMIKFLGSFPKELKFSFKEPSSQSFLSTMIMSHYYTLLIVIHRANILRHTTDNYPSWAISFQAVLYIKSMSDCLVSKQMISKVAVLSHNTLTTSAIIMLYHLLNEDPKVSEIAKAFFLRVLGIWKSSYKKFPSCYPMLCIFGNLYNSEQYLKEVVKSVAPKDKGREKVETENYDIDEKSSRSLKLPDLSFITHPNFDSNMANSIHNNIDQDYRMFFKIGIDFNKLFTDPVFTEGSSLLPRSEVNNINGNDLFSDVKPKIRVKNDSITTSSSSAKTSPQSTTLKSPETKFQYGHENYTPPRYEVPAINVAVPDEAPQNQCENFGNHIEKNKYPIDLLQATWRPKFIIDDKPINSNTPDYSSFNGGEISTHAENISQDILFSSGYQIMGTDSFHSGIQEDRNLDPQRCKYKNPSSESFPMSTTNVPKFTNSVMQYTKNTEISPVGQVQASMVQYGPLRRNQENTFQPLNMNPQHDLIQKYYSGQYQHPVSTQNLNSENATDQILHQSDSNGSSQLTHQYTYHQPQVLQEYITGCFDANPYSPYQQYPAATEQLLNPYQPHTNKLD